MKLYLLFSAAFLAACATDNGNAVYGDQFPPNAKVDASQDASPIPGDTDGGDDDDDTTDGGKKPDADASTGPCGTIAVFAGGDTALSGAFKVDGNAWSGAAIANGAAKGTPKIVPFGSGFLAATWGAGDALQITKSNGAAFEALSTLGVAALKTAPGLTVSGTKAHVTYAAGADYKFYHGSYDGAAWAPTGVDEAVGAPQAVGNSSAALAPSGTDLAFVQAGTNNGLYFNKYTTAWDTAAGINGAGAYAFSAPAMIATPGAGHDLVIVFAEKDTHRITWTARTGAAFSTPATADANAITTSDLAIARVGAFTLLVTYRGTDGKGWAMFGTESGAAINWGAPAALAGGVAIDSPPAVAPGVCGDDGIVVFASGGAVKATRLRGSTFSAPETVTGAAGTRVAVATRPNP